MTSENDQRPDGPKHDKDPAHRPDKPGPRNPDPAKDKMTQDDQAKYEG